MPEAVEVYEGPQANAELAAAVIGDYDDMGHPNPGQPARLSDTEGLQLPWTARSDGTVDWHTGSPDGTGLNPRVQCLDQGATSDQTWPDEGSRDSGDFTLSPSSTASAGSHALVKFSGDPDYENPADHDTDNLYELRVFNRHGLHLLGEDGAFPGCDGSALDLRVRVKDVGPPAPPRNVTATVQRDGTIDVSWDMPHANKFTEDGKEVDFPHNSFNVSALVMSHTPSGLTQDGDPYPNPAILRPHISGVQNLRGEPNTAYTFTLWLRNSEGLSEPASVSATIPGKPGKPAVPTVAAHGPRSLQVSWTAPADGGASLTGYAVQYRKKGAEDWEDWSHAGTTTSATITGLEIGTTYQVQVQGINAIGPSEWSDPGEGSTALNTVNLSADETTTVMGGDNASVTVRLAAAQELTVKLDYSWTNNFGTDRTVDTQAQGRATWNVNIPVDEGETATAATGVLTVSVADSDDYTVGSDSSVSIPLAIGNRAPVLQEPASASLSYLFPRGAKARLDFSGEPATDMNGDPISYSMTFARSGMDERHSHPAQALLRVERDGDDFLISALGTATVAQYVQKYGQGHGADVLAGTLKADDGRGLSDTLEFELTLTHDASAQFKAPAVHGSGQRWNVETAYSINEGAGAGSAVAIPWEAVAAGERTWHAGLPTGTVVRCQDHAGARTENWAAAGTADSGEVHRGRRGQRGLRERDHSVQGRARLREPGRRRPGQRVSPAGGQRPRHPRAG